MAHIVVILDEKRGEIEASADSRRPSASFLLIKLEPAESGPAVGQNQSVYE